MDEVGDGLLKIHLELDLLGVKVDLLLQFAQSLCVLEYLMLDLVLEGL